MRKAHILVAGNCQAFGLAAVLQWLCPDAIFTAKDLHSLKAEIVSNGPMFTLADFDAIVAHPGVGHLIKGCDNPVLWAPGICFGAYHPDQLALLCHGHFLQGPLSDYHSLIAFAGFKRGLDLEQTIAKFSHATYRAVGYFDCWETEKRELFLSFHNLGFSIENYFYDWCRRGNFLFSQNHPRIFCFNGIAGELLKQLGLKANGGNIDVPDNLSLGPIFPIYPEIGDHYGIAGSYVFKSPGHLYSQFNLREFVTGSFMAYESIDLAEVTIPAYFAERFERIMAARW